MNINDNCWVELTPVGERLWAKYWNLVSADGVPVAVRKAHTEASGRIRFQVWQLMAVFGPEMENGLPIPFVANEVFFDKG